MAKITKKEIKEEEKTETSEVTTPNVEWESPDLIARRLTRLNK